VLDVDSGAEERLDQAGSVDNVEHRRLERGPASLMMRREPLFHDARLDAVARQFAGRKESGGSASDDQDRRRARDVRHVETHRAA
jgi:hypothetical protein